MLQLHSSPVQRENCVSAHVMFAFVMAHMVFAFTMAAQCSGREKDNVPLQEPMEQRWLL